jgi:dTDP-L-rhamnose 4-epimerase
VKRPQARCAPSGKYHSVLITGGAGFIGSHTADLLLQKGYEVTIIDNLDPQVHGPRPLVPAYLSKSVTTILEDIRNKGELAKALQDVDVIIHLASAVGVGQSMYQVERYIDCNTRGTAVLLDVLVNSKHDVKKLVVAASMSSYGEGKYYCDECESSRAPTLRELSNESKLWEHRCVSCDNQLRPVPTDEKTPLRPTSIYAMSKQHQEEMSILTGRTYGLPTVALRFFNVYGPRQALSNPYTGAIAIFLNRILNGKPPYIFEDGNQLRDFIHVSDIARACLLALENEAANYLPVNIGTGKATSIIEVARVLAEICESDVTPYVSNLSRKGDVRHCYADIRRAKELLGFQSNVSLATGLMDVVKWAKATSPKVLDNFDNALRELEEKQLA